MSTYPKFSSDHRLSKQTESSAEMGKRFLRLAIIILTFPQSWFLLLPDWLLWTVPRSRTELGVHNFSLTSLWFHHFSLLPLCVSFQITTKRLIGFRTPISTGFLYSSDSYCGFQLHWPWTLVRYKFHTSVTISWCLCTGTMALHKLFYIRFIKIFPR